MASAFGGLTATKLGIPADMIPVTPNDSADLPLGGALYIGTAGNIAVRTAGSGTTVRVIPVLAGQYLICDVTRVMSTSTTAGSIFVAVFG